LPPADERDLERVDGRRVRVFQSPRAHDPAAAARGDRHAEPGRSASPSDPHARDRAERELQRDARTPLPTRSPSIRGPDSKAAALDGGVEPQLGRYAERAELARAGESRARNP